MKKIKEIWQNNKILWVLFLILLVCFIAIISVGLSFFLGGSKTVYGERLKDKDKYPITEVFKTEYEKALRDSKLVSELNINEKGRIIYVNLMFNPDTTLVEAESIASKSLEKFPKELLEYYDIQFTLKCDGSKNSDGFIIMGAHNVAGSGIVWNNNTKVESDK